MPTLEAGVFLLLLILAFIFTFVAFRSLGNARGFFRITALSLFLILSVFVGSGYEVAATSSMTDGSTTWNTTKLVFPGGEESYWIAWLFSGFAFVNFLLLIKDYKEGM